MTRALLARLGAQLGGRSRYGGAAARMATLARRRSPRRLRAAAAVDHGDADEDADEDDRVSTPSSSLSARLKTMRDAFTVLPQIETLAQSGLTQRVEMPDEMLQRLTTLLKARTHSQLRNMQELQREAELSSERHAPRDMHKRPIGWTMERDEQVAPVVYGPSETMTHLAFDVDASFACLTHAMRQLQRQADGTFAPRSMLDFGAGPGTASWVARECFGESLTKYRVLEPSQSMVDAAQAMLHDFPGLSIRRSLAELKTDLRDGVQFDLIVVGFVLSEIPTDYERVASLSALWELLADQGVLVLVDYGSTWGSHQVRSARQFVLDSTSSEDGATTAQILAPCPHAFACPSKNGTWCHFVQRAPRVQYPRDATPKRWHGHQGSKFSYVCIRKQVDGRAASAPHHLARLVRGPLLANKHVHLDLCMPNGSLERHTVTKRKAMSEAYRAARKSHWGALWPADPAVYADAKAKSK